MTRWTSLVQRQLDQGGGPRLGLSALMRRDVIGAATDAADGDPEVRSARRTRGLLGEFHFFLTYL